MGNFRSVRARAEFGEDTERAGLFAEGVAVPLQGISVFVNVLDMASKVTIRQRFKNALDHSLEATYCFPVTPGAAINGFKAMVSGRRIEGVVKIREDAFEAYDEAMEQGHGAFLMDEEQEDIFIVSVGNLKPGEEAEIEISYVARLDVVGKKVRLTLPTTISPRYAPAGSDPVKVDRISPPVWSQVPYGLSVMVHIQQADGITYLSSPSHKTNITKNGGAMVVKLHQSETALDRDFILEFEAERFAKPRAIISRHSNGKKAIMVSWIPEIPDESPKNDEGIIFVLDCSGSMGGSSIAGAQEALKHCIQGLVSETPFNIITFGSEHRKLFDEIVPCTDENRKAALTFVEKIDADMGGTEIFAPLVAAYAMMGKAFCNIFLLTDGEVYNIDEVTELAGKHRDRARVFSFGIGYGPSHALIEGVATASGGGAVFISPDESIEEKVTRQFARFGTPRVTDIAVDWGGLTVADIPLPYPPVFSGEPFALFGLVAGGNAGEIVLTGKSGESGIRFVAPVTAMGDDDLIPILWAKQQIRELETGGIALKGSQQVERKREKTESEIERVALEFQLMSSRTSFVAVMEREDGKKSLETPVFMRVPTQLTRGWHGVDASISMCKAPAVRYEARHQRCVSTGQGSYSSEAIYRTGKHDHIISEKISPRKKVVQRKRSSEELAQQNLYNYLHNCRKDSGEFAWNDFFLTRYAFPFDELKQLVEKMEGVSDELKKTALMTTLAILIIERITTFKGKCTIYIKQATQWLNTNAPNACIDGKPVREILESIVVFERVFAVKNKNREEEK